MNFAEWYATGTHHSVEKGCDILGIDDAYFDSTHIDAFVIFHRDTYMERMADGRFYCNVDREEFIGDRETVAKWLYFEWAVSESIGRDEWNEASLSTLLGEWCEYRGLKCASADETLHDICDKPPFARSRADADNIRTLQWFIELWNEVTS